MKRICISSLKLVFYILLGLLFLPEVSGKGSSKKPVSEHEGLRVALFDLDVTPPVGYDLGGVYGTIINTWDMGLRAKGIVLLGTGDPIVLLAIDWIGIYNQSHDEFRRSLADAARTTPQRVAVHSLHQHDAPRASGNITCDFILATLQKIQMAVRQSILDAQPVTHVGYGEAEVRKVASNRLVLGSDGQVMPMRGSSCRDSTLRAAPVGVIDPMVSLISLWNYDKPLAVLSYYATHPQSYYLTGIPNPDFPGIARFFRQLDVPEALHIHFTGASGNVAAGKYNDGSRENRLILAERLTDGMKRAWEATRKEPVNYSDVEWAVEPVTMVPALQESNPSYTPDFVQRYKDGVKIDIGCLSIGNSRVLFMPGELFVEYQLAAKATRPDLFVAMAAYGDGGPGYIPTAEAFKVGGRDVRVSRLTPEVENVLMTAIRKLLNANN